MCICAITVICYFCWYFIILCLGADLVQIFRYHDIESDEIHPYYHHFSDVNRIHRVRRNASHSGMSGFTVTEFLNISVATTLSPQPLTDIPATDDGQVTNTDIPELESTSFLPDNSSSNFTIIEVSSLLAASLSV